MSGMLFNLLDFVLDGLRDLEISWPVRPALPSRPGPSANSPNRPNRPKSKEQYLRQPRSSPS
jgi:hypothetical protein